MKMIRLTSTAVLLMYAFLCHAADWQEDDFRSAGMIVTSLKNIVQFSMTRSEMQRSLASIPNSKPHYKAGVYQGQVFTRDGRETGFLWATFKQERAVLSGFGAPPMRPEDAKQVYSLFDRAMTKHFSRTRAGVYELGNGLRAELNFDREGKGAVVSIFVMR